MLIENTINKLYEMRLNSMAQTFRDQMTDTVYGLNRSKIHPTTQNMSSLQRDL